jgi:DNA polymerase III epsilon subunit-like protein
MAYDSKYIVLDTEHGGFDDADEPLSLLEAGFAIYNHNWERQDGMLLKVMPDDGIFHVTGEAMAVNKINLVQHAGEASCYKDVKTRLYEFLDHHSEGGKIKLTPVGHHVSGDIKLVCRDLLAKRSWNAKVSYRVLDTGSTAQFLRARGILPHTEKGSLISLCQYYGIDVVDAHTSMGDVEMTAKLMEHFSKMEIK